MDRPDDVRIRPALKRLHSPDLPYGQLPPDPEDCKVFIQADIGPEGGEAADTFNFTAVTHRAASRVRGRLPRRGYLVVPAFSWLAIEAAIDNLLCRCQAESWDDVAR